MDNQNEQRARLNYHEGQLGNLRNAIASVQAEAERGTLAQTTADAMIANWQTLAKVEEGRVADCLRNLGELDSTPISPFGGLEVIASADGNSWESITKYINPPADLSPIGNTEPTIEAPAAPEPSTVPEVVVAPVETPLPLDSMTVAALKAHADEHGIDLGDATKKADIVSAIQSAVPPTDNATE